MQDQFDEELDTRSANTSGMGFGQYLLLTLLILGGIFGARHFIGPSAAMAGWGHDWSESLDQSAKSGKPMLVLFTADWCPPCRSLKSDVLGDSDVSSYLTREFTLLKVDLTDRDGPNNATAQTYGVRGIPTMIVFDARGNQIDRITGGGDKQSMMPWFQAARAKAR